MDKMSKLFKQRYEYYKGTTKIIDNEFNEFVLDVVDRLNTQHYNKTKLIELKQQLEKKIALLEEQDEIYHNQLAIEQLEIIKEKAMEQQSNGWGIKYKDRWDIIMDIDKQIKKLKGE